MLKLHEPNPVTNALLRRRNCEYSHINRGKNYVRRRTRSRDWSDAMQAGRWEGLPANTKIWRQEDILPKQA